MCVIAVSRKGVRQPSLAQIRAMWAHNPHGAGYMVARDGKVMIHKGFMDCSDFIRAIKEEHFTAQDPVVYHFRIATQGGINPGMTHPFPLSSETEKLTALDVSCPIGLAHNGIIPMTSSRQENQYSDTALYISNYMTLLIRNSWDAVNPKTHDLIAETTHSKWAIMDGVTGLIATVGRFIDDKGLLFSNDYFRTTYTAQCKLTGILR